MLEAGAEALGIRLSSRQLEQFRRYYEELLKWNSRVNLTSITGWEEVQTRHFVDSLTVSLGIPVTAPKTGRLIDVGTGAGFPGLPLKVASPQLSVTLVDATAKKTAFLEALVETLGLEGVEVRTGRSESLAHEPDLREGFDFAVARAVADMAALAELTLPYCRLGGLVIAQKTLDCDREILRSRRAIDLMGGRLEEVKRLPPLGDFDKPRGLVILEKLKPTPGRYPRRPGAPVKRPL